MKYLVLFILTMPLLSYTPEEGERTVYDFEVCTIKGNCADLSARKNGKGMVLVFLQPDCPIAQKYTLTLREMVDTLSLNGISVVGVVPGTYYTNKDIKKFTKKYKLNFPIYLDRTNELTKHMKAEVSPEVFLVDPKATLHYSGKIDNWFEALGVYRSIITEYYLKDAVHGLLTGTEIKVKKTQAVGCLLEY